MEKKAGSSTVTYRLKLRCKHPDWVCQTESLYNEVIAFYNGLLTADLSLLELGNMELLRRLEQMTVMGRDKLPPPVALPFCKLPLYFRRAAINAAIGSARSYLGQLRDWEQQKSAMEQKGFSWKKRCPASPTQFHASTLLYKGMYKDFADGRILIKLWNGSSWSWVLHGYSGRVLPKGARLLSPTLVVRGKGIWLHVPVCCPVEDVRTVRERVQDGERFCTVSFSASDVMAVCSLFGSDGHAADSRFIRGGKEFAYRRKRLLNQINRNRRSAGGNLFKGENKRLWKALCNLDDYYAHLVSRRILGFCEKHGVKLVVAPQYGGQFPKSCYGPGTGASFLGKRVIRYLGYKAWRQGIVVTAIPPYYAAAKCNHCQSVIRCYNEGHPAAVNYYGGRLFVCPNGHKGNVSLNTAKNIGRLFLQKTAALQKEKAG